MKKGQKIKPWKCPYCGSIVDNGDKRCSNCGEVKVEGKK
jgi:rubrerythrin